MPSMSAPAEQPIHHSHIHLHAATHTRSTPAYTRSKQESNKSSPTQQSDSSPKQPFKCPMQANTHTSKHKKDPISTLQTNPKNPKSQTTPTMKIPTQKKSVQRYRKSFSNATYTHSKEATRYKAQSINHAMFCPPTNV